MKYIYITVLLLLSCSVINGQVYRSVSEASGQAIERKALLERGLIATENPIAQFDLNNIVKQKYTLSDPSGKLNRFEADTIIRRNNGLISWIGKNLNNGSFVNYVINTNAQSINGTIVLGKKAYDLFGIDHNTALLIDNNAYQNSRCGNLAPPTLSKQSRVSNNSRMTGQDCNLRLLFAYTPNSKAMINDMEGYIQARIDFTNLAYDNSNIDFHAEVAFIYETYYDDSDTSRTICWADGIPHPDKFTDLCNFHHVSDPFMPEVHEYRDQYKADICILIDSQLPTGVTGQAFLPPIINDGEAFVCIAVNSSVTTTAHEIGHTQGCHHDYQNDPTATDNHGYVHIGASVEESFRTVMAYANACVDNFGQACTRIPYFSDPDILFNGVPVGEVAVPGISGAKNAINIMNQKALVNGFRDYPAIHTLPATTLHSGTFAYPIASNELGNLTTYVIEDSSDVHFRSENYITLRPGFQSQEGAFFEGSIGTECNPPFVNPSGVCSEYGYSVDIYGNFAVVGDPLDSSWGPNAGAVYLYEKISGSWILKQKFYSPFSQEGDRYGHSVAIYDSSIIVGAPFKDGAQPDGGRAYIYKITDSTLVREVILDNTMGTSSQDRFGFSVDINRNIAIVGAPGDVFNGPNSGSVKIYLKQGGNWLLSTKNYMPNGNVGDEYGFSVALSSNNVAVGVPGFDSLYQDQGLVATLRTVGGYFTHFQSLYVDDLSEGARLGHDIDIGIYRIIAGAPGDNKKGINSGSAYIFKILGTWSLEDSFRPDGLNAFDRFGFSVSIDSDNAIIGSPKKAVNPETVSKVYTYSRGAVSWFPENILQQPAPLKANYAHSVSNSGSGMIVSALSDFPTCEIEGTVHSYIQAPNGFWILEPGDLEASARQIETKTRSRQNEGIRRE